MDTSLVMDIAVESLKVTALVGAPVLGAALISGLLIGVLQAATSIQEMTLSFIPKLAVMLLALVLFSRFFSASHKIAQSAVKHTRQLTT